MKNLKRRLVLTLIIASLATASMYGAAPLSFSYQGTLEEGGSPVNGNRDLWFAIYSTPSGAGGLIWKEYHPAVSITSGQFSRYVGQGDHTADGPLTYDKFSDTTRYLAFLVGANFATATEIIRTRIASVPFAMMTGTVDRAAGGTIYGATEILTTNAHLKVDNNCVTLNSSYSSPDVALFVPMNYSSANEKTAINAFVNNFGTGSAVGMYGQAIAAANQAVGADVRASSDQGTTGLFGYAKPYTPSATTGTKTGVKGQADFGLTAFGLSGDAHGAQSASYGVYGEASGSPINWGGYFVGDGYFSGKLGIGTNAPTAKLHIGGTPGVDGIKFPDGTLQTTAAASSNDWHVTGNSSTTPGTNFLGTTDNQALEIKVNGARAFRFEPKTIAVNLLGGWNGNTISASKIGATISGGGQSSLQNSITESFGTIGGGDSNYVHGVSGTVGGGHANVAGSSVSREATVGGGAQNTATGSNSVVAGGIFNVASGASAAIGGGRSNDATGGLATVAGGWNNLASDTLATVGGGFDNVASGAYSTVPGGDSCTADGNFSFAAGHLAKAMHPGAFVWADGQASDFTSTADNQFLIRATGNVGINTETPNSTLHVNGSFATKFNSYSQFGFDVPLTSSMSVVMVTPFAVSGDRNVTLPDAAGLSGRQYTIKRLPGGGTGSVIVQTTGGDLIDAATTYTLSAAYKYVTVVSSGTQWYIIANN
jgi:hypothetical protein